MRLRYRAAGVSGQAAPDPVLTTTRGRLAGAKLYVITPESSPERVVEVAAGAMRGGADVIQLRHKAMPRGELLALARRLRAVVGEGLFVVNDYVDLALLAAADGVHLGPDDLSVEVARRVAGDRLLIGASASTVEAARAAVAAGADYIGCGPAFATPVKPEKTVIGPQAIALIASAVEVPVFAIGGITRGNLARVVGAGVRRVCVIRAVGEAPDPEAATRQLRAMLDA